MEAVLRYFVSGMLTMAASLFSATMCFLKTQDSEYLLLSCFPEVMWPLFADMRS
jgi:hypothetical protein